MMKKIMKLWIVILVLNLSKREPNETFVSETLNVNLHIGGYQLIRENA